MTKEEKKIKECKHKFVKLGFNSGNHRYIPTGYIFCEKCGEGKELKF